MGMKNDTPALEAITALGWETLESYRAKSKALQMYKVLNDLAPNALVDLFMRKSDIMSSGVPLLHCSKCLFPGPKI